MPASTCDPVNTALRHALSSERSPGSGGAATSSSDLDSRLVVSAKTVLNSHIEFEQSETYKSTVLDNLKSKYIVLGSANSTTKSVSKQQMTPETNKDDEIQEPKHVLFPLDAVQLGWRETGWHTGVGMYNTGNTCYLNSTLQALFHVPALINWLISDKEHRSNCDSNCMVCAVAKTLLASQTQTQQPIRPWMVSSKLRLVCRHLVPGRQEDAHEFLRYLVEAMERAYIQRFRIENLDARSKETTPLNQIFGGYLRSAVRCLQCGHVSTTVQHFQDLLLDIRKAGTLDDALASYFACERLDDLAYRCESCRKKVSAYKQFSLERAPYVLCIQLKRFAGAAGGKITKHIAFRQYLELSRYLHRKPATPLVYKLVALVTHMGMSANCGHYTAIGLTPSGNYYEFDDCSVRSVTQQIVLNTNAYIMFYELEQDSQPIFSDKINGKISMKNNNKSTIVQHSSSPPPPSTSPIIKLNSPAHSTSSILSPSSNLEFISTPSSNSTSKLIVPTPSNNTVSKSIISSNNTATKSIGSSSSPTKTVISSFKTNLIPTPIRNKTLNSALNSADNNNNSDKTENFYSDSPKVNGLNHKSNDVDHAGRNNSSENNNYGDYNSRSINNDMSRLLESPPRRQSVSPPEHRSSTPPIENVAVKTKTNSRIESNSNPIKNGYKSDQSVINGVVTSNRRLVPYDSDGCSSTNSESEDTPSGKWRRTECRAPSLNGDDWRCQTKAANILKLESNESNNNSNEHNGSSNHNSSNSTVQQLLRTSHSGYGTSVSSWTGGRSALEKEVANERREQYKRHRTDVDELDRGRIKKIRRQNGILSRSNPGYNPFQEYQQQSNHGNNNSINNNHSNGNSHGNSNGWPQNSSMPFRSSKHFYNTGNARYHRRRFFPHMKHNRYHR